MKANKLSLLLTDTERDTTDAWFGYSVQKMVSVAASMATLYFNENLRTFDTEKKHIYKYGKALFDARAFSIPEHEVVNYFIWRQQDATRNSIQMVARASLSQKELNGKNTSELNEYLWTIGINYNEISTIYKRGFCLTRESFDFTNTAGDNFSRSLWVIDSDIPIFTKNREYIEITFQEEK